MLGTATEQPVTPTFPVDLQFFPQKINQIKDNEKQSL